MCALYEKSGVVSWTFREEVPPLMTLGEFPLLFRLRPISETIDAVSGSIKIFVPSACPAAVR
jgi:hypothetical protein